MKQKIESLLVILLILSNFYSENSVLLFIL
jgi:hypothetical protein